MTTERSVAEYWACNAVFGDLHNRPNMENSGIVLLLDSEKPRARDYYLREFHDDIWGEGKCDWEIEIACPDDIEPLSEFLIAAEPITSDRYQDVIEHGFCGF